jgi:hypothetical protein
MLRMVLVAQDNVQYLPDRPCFIWSTINIESQDRFGEGPGCQSAPVNITLVYEESGGSGINEGLCHILEFGYYIITIFL